MVEPSPAMLSYFGTTPEDCENGILQRIRKTLVPVLQKTLDVFAETRAAAGEDFRLMYPSMRADGSKCYIQMDAYFDKVGRWRLLHDHRYGCHRRDTRQRRGLTGSLRKTALCWRTSGWVGIYHITEIILNLSIQMKNITEYIAAAANIGTALRKGCDVAHSS